MSQTNEELLAQAQRDQGGAEALAKLAIEYLGCDDPSDDHLSMVASALHAARILADHAALCIRRREPASDE